jgi:murein DD-endopeptidase MepM/ murein hydrolase activator NlpD
MPSISSPYGPRIGGDSNFHHGTDFIGFAIGKAVLGGTVTLAGQFTKNAGISVAIDSKDPITGKLVTIVYMHASSVRVRKGQVVNAGDAIMNVGSTGNATGVCDHTEIRYWDGPTPGVPRTVDPVPTIKAWMSHVAVQPKPGRASRTVGNVRVNGRNLPTTKARIDQVLAPHTVGTFDGWRKGESVNGNNVWFRGAFGHNWFWSGAFTNTSVSGLPQV